jgi:UDP-glucose 4-epimerase
MGSGEENQGQRVLVTGGGGYIGSHVMRELADRGYSPVAYDNLSSGQRRFVRGYEFIEGDIRDEDRLGSSLQGIRAILHFAAYIEVGESVENPQKYYDNNVAGSLTLLRAALRAGVKYVVFSSSAAVYGRPSVSPTPENAPAQPINPYGLSKLFVERALSAYGSIYGLRSVALRYFNAAGAHESGTLVELHRPETHLIPSLLLVAAGYRPVAEIFGTDLPTPDGSCIRDFIHVNDLAAAHVLALDYLFSSGPNTVLNLGTGTGHSVLEVVHTVERVTGQKLPIRISPRRPGDPPVLVADSTRARELLRWIPTRSLDDIVATAWRALQANRDLFREPALKS